MRKLGFVILICLLTCSAVSVLADNMLHNGDFSALGANWQITGAPQFSGGLGSGTPGEPTTATQNVALASGAYTVNLSTSYAVLHPYSYVSLVDFQPGFLTMSILVDGTSVATWRILPTDMSPATGPSVTMQHNLTWSGYVSGSIGVRFVTGSARYTMYDPDLDSCTYPVVIRNASLTTVPEPTSMVALFTGIAGLAFARRRRVA